MTRALLTQDHSDVGVFAPLQRPRLVARLAALANYPVALVIAPAGYGKSVAIRQYVSTVTEAAVTFTLHSEHATLLGFLRGFTHALAKHAPHASSALAGAYERNTVPKRRAGELAAWLRAHLESFSGLIVLDDLHVGDDDPEIAQIVTALIQRTKNKVRWLLASRSTTGLPVGTWLAYGDADLALDEHDLRFNLEEARTAARRLQLATPDEEVEELLALTEGWPAAMSFALRTSIRSAELRSVSATTREMVYRLLAEQVYTALEDDERDLLEVAAALPSIDIAVLESAGFDRALTLVERLRERTSFIYEESTGIYQCHELFREFLRHQTALGGKRAQQLVQARAARSLESVGDFEHALGSFAAANLIADVIRLLEEHGFELLERARGDVVARALEGIDEKTRRENGTLLALQGALHAIAGKFARAESFFRRSLNRANGDRDLIALVSLRLASIMANQGQDVTQLLSVVGTDPKQPAADRAEALSLIAAQQAALGKLDLARKGLARLEPLIPEIEGDAVKAKVLHRTGIALHHLGSPNEAFEALVQSSELASDLHFYGIASRANAVLSNLTLHEDDDVGKQLHHAEMSAEAALKAGDTFALQTAQLQILSAWMRRGDIGLIIQIEQQLTSGKASSLVDRFLTLFRSLRLAWEGRFSEAHKLLGSCWTHLTFEFDRIVAGSEYALFLALDQQVEASGSLVKEILELISSSRSMGLFRVRSICIAKMLCALSEAVNGRPSKAQRIMSTIYVNGDGVIGLAKRVIDAMILRQRDHNVIATSNIEQDIAALAEMGYADIANLLLAVERSLYHNQSRTRDGATLTHSELDILRLLSHGFTPKEVALQKGRSVYTIRVHIANAMAKLGGKGRAESIQIAKGRGLI